jgi:hypothetical protein
VPCAHSTQLEEEVIEPGMYFERLQKVIDYGMSLWKGAEKYREARRQYDLNCDLARSTKHQMRRIIKTDIASHPSSDAFLGITVEDDAKVYIVEHYFQIDDLDSLSTDEVIHQIPNLTPLIGMAKIEADRVQKTMESINCDMKYYRNTLHQRKPVYGGIIPDTISQVNTARRNTSSFTIDNFF